MANKASQAWGRKRKCSRSYARKQIGRIRLARHGLKRSRRQSWLCFGGGSDSAEWSGGGGGAGGSDYQHAISIYEESDSNQYSSSQPVHRVGHWRVMIPNIVLHLLGSKVPVT
ncbi:hypothetical protein QYF36_021186 [Acer negundo]|nr:hypothetical protein QYF36_021186 [Acer negundo]